MKIAVLSDIHGHFKALQVVFADLAKQNVDIIFILGDTLGYGDNSLECFRWAEVFAEVHLQGNHEFGLYYEDRDLVFTREACANMEKTARFFSDGQVETIKKFPLTHHFDDLNISLAHGSFSAPTDWRYVFRDEAAEEINFLKNQIGFLGHTHEPFIFGDQTGHYPIDEILLVKKYEKYLINVGSVGRMYDDPSTAVYGLLQISGDLKMFQIKRLPINERK